MIKLLYVDTLGAASHSITSKGIINALHELANEGLIEFKVINHFQIEHHFIKPFEPDWAFCSTPLTHYTYLLKKKGYRSLGYDLEGTYEWDRFSKTDSPNFDAVATVDKAACDKLKSIGVKNVLHLPLGFDASVYNPLINIDDNHRSDVCITGVMFDNRVKIVNALAPLKGQIKLRVIAGWANRIQTDHVTYLHKIDSKFMPIEDVIKYYLGAKIILIGHRDYEPANSEYKNGLKGTTPGRIFQETALKRLVMVDNTRPETLDYFKDGKEIIVFNDDEDLRNKVMYYLQHDEIREWIASNGYNRTIKENTYKHRLLKMIAFLQGVDNGI